MLPNSGAPPSRNAANGTGRPASLWVAGSVWLC